MRSLLQSRQVRGAPEQAASRTPPVITRAEACPRGHGRMDLHYANWERFCRYHVGDWYGLWTPYTVDGVALAPRQCIRSFQRTADGHAITHQNHYRYADGRQETTTFGPYTPATTRGVFVEASFSWGVSRRGWRDPVRLRDRVPGRRAPRQPRGPQRRPRGVAALVSDYRAPRTVGRASAGGGDPLLPWGWRGLRRTITPTCGSPPRTRSRGAGSKRWARTG